MKTELTPVRDLRPYPNNARTHSRKQLRQIARSIEKFGFCNPVLVDDTNQIIAGHGRVEAAKLLGIEAVPTCRLSHLSDADKRAYILADNKIASAAGWDKDLLAIELQGLIELNVEVELTEFEMGAIDLLLEEVHKAKGPSTGPEDALPQYLSSPAVTQRGDLWSLGDHALLCGDARDQGAYDRLLEGAKAQFVFTDPPYNVAIDGNVCGLGRIRKSSSHTHPFFFFKKKKKKKKKKKFFFFFFSALVLILVLMTFTGDACCRSQNLHRVEELCIAHLTATHDKLAMTFSKEIKIHEFDRSTNWSSSGNPEPDHTSTILNWGNTGAIENVGPMPASTRCGWAGWKSSQCTRR